MAGANQQAWPLTRPAEHHIVTIERPAVAVTVAIWEIPANMYRPIAETQRSAQLSSPFLRWSLPSAIAQENFRRVARLWHEHRTDLEASLDEALFEDADRYSVTDEGIPSKHGRARILANQQVREQILLWPEALQYFGQGLAVLPFAATFHADLRYEALGRDFQDLPAERVNAAAVEDRDLGRLSVTEGAMVNVRGLAVMCLIDEDASARLEREPIPDDELPRPSGFEASIGCMDCMIANFRERLGSD